MVFFWQQVVMGWGGVCNLSVREVRQEAADGVHNGCAADFVEDCKIAVCAVVGRHVALLDRTVRCAQRVLQVLDDALVQLRLRAPCLNAEL